MTMTPARPTAPYDDAIASRTLAILRDVTGDDEVAFDLDVPLFASGLVDSLAIVSLMLAFQDAFGLVISPADFDKQAWSTPRAVVADVERRMVGKQTA